MFEFHDSFGKIKIKPILFAQKRLQLALPDDMRHNSGMSRIDWGLVGIIEDPRANIQLTFNTCFYASLRFTKSAIVYGSDSVPFPF